MSYDTKIRRFFVQWLILLICEHRDNETWQRVRVMCNIGDFTWALGVRIVSWSKKLRFSDGETIKILIL